MKLNIKILGLVLLISMSLIGCSKAVETVPEEQHRYKEEVTEETEKPKEERIEGDQEMIIVEDNYFVADMDKIFTDLEAYVGKTIKYEGFISRLNEGQYAVTRYYDMGHEDHIHEVLVGLETIYEGTWPAVNTWVEITGVIEDKAYEGQIVPVVKATEMTIKENRGLKKVTN